MFAHSLQDDFRFPAFFDFAFPAIDRLDLRQDGGAGDQVFIQQGMDDPFSLIGILAAPKYIDHGGSLINV